MQFDRHFLQIEVAGDLFVGLRVHQSAQHLALSLGQGFLEIGLFGIVLARHEGDRGIGLSRRHETHRVDQ